MRRRRLRVIATMLVCASSGAAATANEHWFTLSVDGVRTGYAREERQPSGNEVIERESVTLFIHQLGHDSRMQRRVEFRHSADGMPLSFDYALDAGTVHTSWRATFVDRTTLQVTAPPPARPPTVTLPDDTGFTPDRSERFAALWERAQPTIDALVFDPARRTSGRMRARVVADAAADEVHVLAISGMAKNAASEDLWFDANGNIQRMETDVFGARLTWTPCTSDCDTAVEKPMDPMARLVVRSPVQIPPWFKHRKLRYVVTRSDGERAQLVQTTEQAVVFDGPRAVVTICAACGNDQQPTNEELVRYRTANAWVQSDDAEIRHLALNTVARTASVDFRMRKLVQLVMRRMLSGTGDFLGYGDAVTALHTGSGDCTEFAVLLAALARAQGIPTRIAAGLAYSDRFSGKKDVFSPHTWVQVWDGKRWRSYDAALDGFDSTHIAFAVGSGEPYEFDALLAQLPLLKIDKAGAVREK